MTNTIDNALTDTQERHPKSAASLPIKDVPPKKVSQDELINEEISDEVDTKTPMISESNATQTVQKTQNTEVPRNKNKNKRKK